MTSLTVSDLYAVRTNPAAIQDIALDKLQQAMGVGFQIVDANSPFIYGLEVSAVNAAMIMAQHQDLISEYYPVHARSMADLGRWMSDEDRVGIGATPASTVLAYAISAAEVRNRAVTFTESDDGLGNSYKKLVIPKDTVINILDVPFCVDYAFEIRIMQHGGFQIVYDANVTNTLTNLTTNYLEWESRYINNDEILIIQVPVRQYDIAQYTASVTASSGFNENYSFSDSFYAVRAFFRPNNATSWNEVTVSFSKQTFDPATLTLSASLDTGSIDLSMPEIYVSNGLGVGKLQIFIYYTKGVYNKDYGSLKGDNFLATYRDFDYTGEALSIYSEPIRLIHNQGWAATTLINGGTAARSFASLKQGVIYDSRKTEIPITPAQISQKVRDRGFDVLKTIDVPTARLYCATSDMPVQDNKGFGSSVGTFTGSMLTTMKSLAAMPTVKNNGDRVTITPETLYMVLDGVFSIVPEATRQALFGMSAEDLCDAIANQQYLFSPFYYVIDTSDDQLNVRIYDMNEPEITDRVFYYENNSVSLAVNIGSYGIDKTATGYRVMVTTKSSDEYKALEDDAVAMQMLFTPQGEFNYAYMTGVLVGRDENRERIYQFDITSNLDIDDSDNLIFDSFGMYGNAPAATKALLKQDFRFITCIDKSLRPNAVTSETDQRINNDYLPVPMVAIIEEGFRIQFGTSLNGTTVDKTNLSGLWRKSRSVASVVEYKKHPQDVYVTYPADVFKRDGDGRLVLGDDGKAILEHAKGDVEYDSDGTTPLIKYAKGTVMLDNNGQPIPLDDRDILRQFDIVTLDGIYYFATASLDKDYMAAVKQQLINWVVSDIAYLQSLLLERTWINYQPKRTLGELEVTVNADLVDRMDAALSFTVSYYLTKVGYANDNLKASLRTSTPTVLNACLKSQRVAVSDIIGALREIVTDDVVDIKVEGFGDAQNIDVATVDDETLRFALKKKLIIAANKDLTVQEDVTVNFLRHRSE